MPDKSKAIRDMINGISSSPVPACEYCNADVRIIEEEPMVYRMTVLHDDWCEWYSSRKGKK